MHTYPRCLCSRECLWAESKRVDRGVRGPASASIARRSLDLGRRENSARRQPQQLRVAIADVRPLSRSIMPLGTRLVAGTQRLFGYDHVPTPDWHPGMRGSLLTAPHEHADLLWLLVAVCLLLGVSMGLVIAYCIEDEPKYVRVKRR